MQKIRIRPTIEITTKCNWKCKHCFNENQINNYQSVMTTEISDIILDNLINNNFIFDKIGISGGEPFANPEVLFHILKTYKQFLEKPSPQVIISSNLSYLNEDIVKEIHRIMNYAFIASSLIKIDEEFYDDFVGIPGSFNLMKKNIGMAVSNGLRCSVSAIINNRNTDKDSLIKFLEFVDSYGMKNIGCKKIRIPLDTSPKIQQYVSSLCPTPEEFLRATDILLEEGAKRGITVMTSEPMSLCLYPDDIKYNNVAVKCGFMDTHVAISPKGDIRPCQFMPISYNIGNIVEEGLPAVYDKLTAYRNDILNNHACNDCKHFNTVRCIGGCYVDTLVSGKNIYDKPTFVTKNIETISYNNL